MDNNNPSCVIDQIIKGITPAHVVYEDAMFIAFLDYRPLFHGHVLLSPKTHFQTLYDVPQDLLEPLFSLTQKIGYAIKKAMNAEGTFIAMNNSVSQSIPHLHVHIVPRKKGDGLKGFFWPRTHYKDDEEAIKVKQQIKLALEELN